MEQTDSYLAGIIAHEGTLTPEQQYEVWNRVMTIVTGQEDDKQLSLLLRRSEAKAERLPAHG